MDKEGYEHIKVIRSELESVYEELKIAIAARDETMKGLINTLNLLEKLQEEFEKVVEEGVNFFSTLV
jgi:hypothetical protein